MSSDDDYGLVRRRVAPRGALRVCAATISAEDGSAADLHEAGTDEPDAEGVAQPPTPGSADQPDALDQLKHANEPRKSALEAARDGARRGQRDDRRAGQDVRVDYAHDLCKDYAETGFCGFGDSCKFVHDRGGHTDALRRDLEEARKRRRVPAKAEAGDVRGTVSSCGVCAMACVRPVRPRDCAHVFCEACALGLARTSARCAVCNARVAGSFASVRQ